MDITEVLGVLLSAIVFLSWFVLPGGTSVTKADTSTQGSMSSEVGSPA
jgi:hypothetical protein